MNPMRQGIFKENPVFILMLGICPLLAVTTQAINGLGMGIACLVVLTGSNLVISILRTKIPPTVRIPIFIVVIASFVTIVDLVMQAWLPSLAEALGIFIPLITVNCIIFGRVEVFASKNPPLASISDAVGMSVGFGLALILLASLRELFGNGTLTLEILGIGTTISIPFLEQNKAVIMILPPGAFLTLGLLMAFFNHIRKGSMVAPNLYTCTDARMHMSNKRVSLCNGEKMRQEGRGKK